MLNKIIVAVVSVCFGLIAWRCLAFYRNLVQAQKIGLPILSCPIHPLETWWLLSRWFLQPFIEILPFRLGAWVKYASLGWNYPDYYSTHARLNSDAFTLVTPTELEIFLADPQAAESVLKRYQDFIKNPALYSMLDILGPSVNTVNGKTWQRHRRITVPPFNERNSALVWKESLGQAAEVLHCWTKTTKVTTTAPDIMTLALHVLIGAGFGQSYPFEDEDHAKLPTGYTWSYRDALRHVIKYIGVVALMKQAESLQLLLALLSSRVKQTNVALKELKSYLTEFVVQERDAIENSKSTEDKPTLISALIRSAEQEKSSNEYLTDEEIYGNLFLYNLAGHDTTANTLSFAIGLLAAYPQWQDWIQQEIDEVLQDEDISTSSYETTFPRLERCLAVMYETLRLYGPVAAIPRYTSNTPSLSLTIANKEYILPPYVNIDVNLCALHTHPKYWGANALNWIPSRWILSPSSNSGPDASTFFTPPPGTYNPWANGPRICPGKKFSQVEFVAVLASLFNHHRVDAVVRQGESSEEASQRIADVVRDSRIQFTLKMRRPEDMGVRWVRR